eukprot:Hpha_TRINITY_DN12461_c0_g1::TRINITY_DN12461_c0_g1_i3::g.42789::m.42789
MQGTAAEEEEGWCERFCGALGHRLHAALEGKPLGKWVALGLTVSSASLCASAAWLMAMGLGAAVHSSIPVGWLEVLWLSGAYLLVTGALGLVAVRLRRLLFPFAVCGLVGCVAMSLAGFGGTVMTQQVAAGYSAAPLEERCAVGHALNCSADCAVSSAGVCATAVVTDVSHYTLVATVIAASSAGVGTLLGCYVLGPVALTVAAASAALVVMTLLTALWVEEAKPSHAELHSAAVGLSALCNLVSVLVTVMGLHFVGCREHATTLPSATARRRITTVLSMVPVFAVCSFLILIGAGHVPVEVLFSYVRDVYGLVVLQEIAALWASIADVDDELLESEQVSKRVSVNLCMGTM